MSVLEFSGSKESGFTLGGVDVERFAATNAESYRCADPFPHIVIRDFLPPAVLDLVLGEFPTPEQMNMEQGGKTVHNKGSSDKEHEWGEQTRSLMRDLNSSRFIDFLESLTSIEGLVADPHFEGGGLHQTTQGGYLKMHADFNFSRRTNLDRRLNLLLYLNKDWSPEMGGYLELWDKEMNHCVQKIAPEFNTCVVFSTTDFSFHGHPDPMTSGDRTRKSLALYYYSNGRPEEEQTESHTTLYKERPDEKFARLSLQDSGSTVINRDFLEGSWMAKLGSSRVYYRFGKQSARKITIDDQSSIVSEPLVYELDGTKLFLKSQTVSPSVFELRKARSKVFQSTILDWYTIGKKPTQLRFKRIADSKLSKHLERAELNLLLD